MSLFLSKVTIDRQRDFSFLCQSGNAWWADETGR